MPSRSNDRATLRLTPLDALAAPAAVDQPEGFHLPAIANGTPQSRKDGELIIGVGENHKKGGQGTTATCAPFFSEQSGLARVPWLKRINPLLSDQRLLDARHGTQAAFDNPS